MPFSPSFPRLPVLHAAADVMQTAHIMLDCPEVALSNCVDALDELAVLVAAMVHDFKVGQHGEGERNAVWGGGLGSSSGAMSPAEVTSC
jgi:hypothetical protein